MARSRGRNTLDKVSSGGNMADTKFGVVRVYAPEITRDDVTKTYMVTNHTSIRDLVIMVMSGSSAVCQGSHLFRTRLDTREKMSTGSPTWLPDDAIALELRGPRRHPDTRFVIEMSADGGLIHVEDHTEDTKPKILTVILDESATCRMLLEMVTRATIRDVSTIDLTFHENQHPSDRGRVLEPDMCPLLLQRMCTEQQCHFRIRDISDDPHHSPGGAESDTSRSLKTLLLSQPPLEVAASHKKLLNIRELNRAQAAVTKRRSSKRNSGDDVTKSSESGSGASTKSRLRESINKLQENLENTDKEEAKTERKYQDSSSVRMRDTRLRRSKSQESARRAVTSEKSDQSGRVSETTPSEWPKTLRKSRSLVAFPECKRRATSGDRERAHSSDRSSATSRGTDDTVSAFEKRKLYDQDRRKKSAEMLGSGSQRSAHRERDGERNVSLENNAEKILHKSSQRTSTSASSTSSRGRQRRELPKLPVRQSEAEVENRKQRLSQTAIKKATLAAGDKTKAGSPYKRVASYMLRGTSHVKIGNFILHESESISA